ncbi:MAG TPA: glycosyltransferase family 2 protein [Nitriliruptorales bacterium]|nr:glycosyltransferase family 2 protein [Nitriliruptorales bacterium]
MVIVTHDTRDEALACLRTLRAAGADEVVLVDSGSSDGTPAAVRAAFDDVAVLELANVGYGQAANVGVARTSAPFVVVANADTRFAPGSVTALADDLDRHAQAGAAGPLVRYPDGRLQASARRFPTLAQAVGHALLGLWWPRNPWTRAYRMHDEDPTAAREVDWLSGCALALRREAFEDVGGFDPGYFMFVEDVDLGYRLRRAGWRVRFAPAAEVVHAVGASTRRRRVWMVVEHARSLDRFYARAYGRGVGRLLHPLVRVGLAFWVALALVWGAIAGVRRGRSSTGE